VRQRDLLDRTLAKRPQALAVPKQQKEEALTRQLGRQDKCRPEQHNAYRNDKQLTNPERRRLTHGRSTSDA